MTDPRRQAFDRLDRARRDACDSGDHRAEVEHAAALVAAVDPRSTADLILASLALWARDGRAWWYDRFVARFGSEPPAGWWLDDPTTAADGEGAARPAAGAQVVSVGQVAQQSNAEQWFDEGDQTDFLAEIEARYRAETGLPARGEGHVSEIHLVRCVEDALTDVEMIRQARPPWLGAGQSLDVFIPSLDLAIEYQGEQHYLALEHWGAEAGLAHRRELDERKRDACLRAGVRLVEWRYDEPVTVASVRARLGLADG